jgi:hypothetical protein
MTDLTHARSRAFYKDEFNRMHQELHDDEYIANHIRKQRVKQMREDKIADTGL